jgi:hypothetical protein
LEMRVHEAKTQQDRAIALWREIKRVVASDAGIEAPLAVVGTRPDCCHVHGRGEDCGNRGAWARDKYPDGPGDVRRSSSRRTGRMIALTRPPKGDLMRLP